MRRWRRFAVGGVVALAAACAARGGATAGEEGLPTVGARAAGEGPEARGAGIGVAVVLDDFEMLDAWRAAPASGVEARIGSEAGQGGGRSLRLDFDFRGKGGWAAFRRELSLELPENYEISFWIRGEAPVNTLEFKLIDPSGENVWWVNRPEFEFPREWRKVTFRKRDVRFAWGPARGGELRRIAALEFAVAAGNGGAGTVWIERLALTPLEPVRPYDLTPVAAAATSLPGHEAALALDGDPATAWRSAGGGRQRFTVDFLRNREYGGVVIEWDPAHRARDYDVQLSMDGRRWETVRAVRDGECARDYLALPEAESRFLRLDLLDGSGDGYAIRALELRPLEWGASRNTLFEEIADGAPRGHYPRYLRREQSYWTVVGVNGDTEEALLNEEGAVEVWKRSFSIEPFLHDGSRLLTWADARTSQSLEKGYLPIPSVARDAGGLGLTVTAWAEGEPGASTLWLRYRVENRTAAPQHPTLFLALRPFQVNPSWQFLNNPGGVATVRALAYDGGVVLADGRRVVPVTRPAAFGAAHFDQGEIVDWLRRGVLPSAVEVRDPVGHASGALAYPLALGAGEAREVYVAVPFHAESPGVAAGLAPAPARALAEPRLQGAARRWEGELDRFTIELPPSAPPLEKLLKATLAYTLINRDGAAIQPGSRAYERSWIRDGSLTSAALLRLGHPDVVRAFIEWFAPFQYDDGKVPCCVDRRGADPVPEHDSHGQLVYLIAEYYRHTGDRALLERMWPHVERAAFHIDSLRQTRRTDAYRSPERLAYFGLLPESISHEGYSEKPMHSYWDDFFALRGLEDAAWIAAALGHEERRAAFAAMRDEFRSDLIASLQRTMMLHGIDYLPGSVELGDFDATSTTVALSPAGAQAHLPEAALRRTFDRYWENFVARREDVVEWEGYTPYELRAVGSFVRLGERRRAHALLDWFLAHQRPAAWRHWAEVVWRDERAPRFIGDMPHTWVGSDFIRSVLDFFAYEREGGDALVIGAGILPEWVRGEGGVRVRGLRTDYGVLGYAMRAEGERVVVEFDGGLRAPDGGLWIRSPLERPIRRVVVDGQGARLTSGDEVHMERVPRRVEFWY